MRPLHSAWNFLWMGGTLLILAGVGAGLVVPLYLSSLLAQDFTTGERIGHFRSLLRWGPLGRHLARTYARNTFHHWRMYGFGYADTPGVILPGSPAADVVEVLGPPDLHAADHDIWWMSRDAVGRQMLSSPGDDDGFSRSHEWNRRIVAEYDLDGRLLRLFIPDMRFDGQSLEPNPERAPPPIEQPPPPAPPGGQP